MRAPPLLLIGLVACAPEASSVGTWREELAVDGRWAIPSDTLALGDAQTVPYTGAGAWTGPDACSGGMEPGTQHLREYLLAYVPQTYEVGGYSCRPIVGDASAMSVHGTGRALDIMLPTTSEGLADNDLGDPIGRWLIAHAAELGIQMIIWDRTTWTAERDPGTKDRPYGGQHPHHDHLHVELSLAAAAEELPWYGADWLAPELPDCAALPATGGVIDDTSACFMMFGPTRSWRIETGTGETGGYRWTNAFEADEPANWARWSLDVAVAGTYDVEVFVPPGQGAYADTRYGVRHAGEDAEVTIDQGAASGWTRLGTFAFAAGRDQRVEIYDNAFAPVGDAARIAVDALRLTPSTGGGGAGDEPGLGMGGGCSVAASPRATGPAGWLLAALCLVGVTRRRRRR